ncbi:hypothetical protein [Bradyrhizobium sp. RDM4]|uniref:hypothetical protein n=1 Tax=Bradyrhizobium sp. RDM4 TaxID=3378765 RepID=UPI0038FBED81
MDLDLRNELTELLDDVRKRQRHIEDQVFLISILDRDGHSTSEQQSKLKYERKQLASQMGRQTKLLQKAGEIPGMIIG